MELRDIEIFLVLAEELHFSRTAERLHVSAARVSQAIKKQERAIGGVLFVRDTRNVRLTPLGERLHRDLRAGYQLIEDGIEGAKAGARDAEAGLTIGAIGPQAHDLLPVTTAFRARHAECRLTFREVGYFEPLAPLRAGEVDLQTYWFHPDDEGLREMIASEPGLTFGPIVITEPKVLMTAATHPLAQRVSVSMEELGDYALVGFEGLDSVPDYWVRMHSPSHTPGGRPIPRGPAFGNWEETMAMVAADRSVCLVSAEAIRYYPSRPGISFVPLHDAPRGRWGLVWRTDRETPMARAYVQVAQDIGPRHFDLN
ncbi:LysR family transcriptional regulator [Streptosporangium sp. 'caverna']|uniref:LysR family transcriptional regulator n=1 Tax=Streptosporangium sp. 'caverna' TaxID=2202249 RepID=UPI000D7EAF1D|nr:LysR family transcriptional regulator [Streptosporangium sp. 'caverna']AWS47843.1 LysR family transcriptional regulator [Streptosporangium sp. 'caverna']